jgi:hypothetical protein
VQGYGNDEPIMQWLPLIKKIQEAGKSVIVDLQMNELDEFIKKVDPIGILLRISAEPSRVSSLGKLSVFSKSPIETIGISCIMVLEMLP